MWLNEQRIQALLNAYCALAQAESEAGKMHRRKSIPAMFYRHEDCKIDTEKTSFFRHDLI